MIAIRRARATAIGAIVAAFAIGCRSSTVDDAREIRRREQPASPMVEDRAGTEVLKTILLPVAALFAGGVSAEPDAARVRNFSDDPHGAPSAAEIDLQRSRFDALWADTMRRMEEKQKQQGTPPGGDR